jgi:transcription initiation factor TFIIIB Brf1 subunit/transcription initiation factor TFIIB
MTKGKENPRHCPSCNGVDLVVDQGVISCKDCGRILEADRHDGTPVIDREWAASAEH